MNKYIVALSSPVLLLLLSFSLLQAQGQPASVISTTLTSTTVTSNTIYAWPRLADVTTPVINHPASQVVPAIDDKRVVWQDDRSGPADIFLADLQTGDISNITQSDAWEANPDISGDIVVWRDGYQGIGVHGVDLGTGQDFTIVEGLADVQSVRISGNIVVWAGREKGRSDWHIYGYNRQTQEQRMLTQGTGVRPAVNIDGDLIVWSGTNGHIALYNWQTQTTQTIVAQGAGQPDVSVTDDLVIWQDNRNGTWDIYGYRLSSGQEVPLVQASAHQIHPRIADGLVAYQSQILDTSWNVHLLVLADQTTFPLTDNSTPQTLPVVDGTNIVWQDTRNHQADIYRFDWQGAIPPTTTYPLAAPSQLTVGAFPQGQIRLQWQNNATGAESIQVERATGIIGTAWEEIAMLPANTTHYTDTPPVLGESYWYRLRAVAAGKLSAYSNESFNSTFSDVPSLNERYLMVLINEARAAPAHFGYSNYPAVPPLAFNPVVAYSARSHSQSILNSAFQFGHCDPSGRCQSARAHAVGYPEPIGCADNLTTGGTGYQVMETMNQGFLSSEGHRNNMLNLNMTEMGIGHTYDVDKGITGRHGQMTGVFCGRTIERPVLPTGAVVPFLGTEETDFTYAVNFYNAAGDGPTSATVVIDGVAYAMTLATGTPALGTYRYQTKLDPNVAHSYYFYFEYGDGQQARWPATGVMNEPTVAVDAAAVGITVNTGACGANIRWQTLGPAQTRIDYGLTANYGLTRTVATTPAEQHEIALTGLAPNQRYHFQIHAEDGAGQMHTTPDQHFTTRRSRILHVPEAYEDLTDALRMAESCDVVHVAPGTYRTAAAVPAGVHLVGSGPEVTILEPAAGRSTVLALDDAAYLTGFTIRASGSGAFDAGIWVNDNGSPTIINNRIAENAVGILSYCFAPPCTNQPRIQNNIIISNSNAGVVDIVGGSHIVNNTIVRNVDGIRINAKSTGTLLQNNIIVQNQNQGIRRDNGAIDLRYNDVWGNSVDYANTAAGPTDISMDPLFVDGVGGDFQLRPGSPAIDAGDPAPAFFDSDGTRNDMGAFGGPALSPELTILTTLMPTSTAPGKELTTTITVSTTSVTPKSVQVRAMLPEGFILLPESVVASSGVSAVAGQTIVFERVTTDVAMPAQLGFRIQRNAGSSPAGTAFTIPLTAHWGGHRLEGAINVIVNNENQRQANVHLPLVWK